MPTLGQQFVFATFAPGELFGRFTSIIGNSFNNDLWMFDIDYDNHDGQILLTVVQKPHGVPEPTSLLLLASGLLVVLRYGLKVKVQAL
jgi:hypothetical protein